MRSMETIMLKRLSLSMILMYLHAKSGHSLLITVPRDTEVLINHSTYFNCATSILSEQIHWYHKHVGENKTNYVYYKGQFNQIYSDRYSIEINTKTGEYNLIICSVQAGDAGRYVCQDDGGLGDLSSAELIVLESTPTCLSSMKQDGSVGPNSCYLPLDKLHLSCSVSFNGNIPPILQWKVDGNDAPILKGATADHSGKRATLNLTASSTVEMDGDVFTCGTTRSYDKQLSCTTDPAKINYAVSQPTILNTAKGETVTCSANASVPCTYRWFYDNDTQYPASYEQVLTTSRLGNHSCEASCPINGINCTFVAIRIIVFEDETPSTAASEDNTKMLIGLLIPAVTILLIIIACVMFFRMRKVSSPENLRSNNTATTENNRPTAATETGTPAERVPLQEGDAPVEAATENGTAVEMVPIQEVAPVQGDTSIIKRSINETNIEETEITTKASKVMGRAIVGVAILDDLLYIVCDNSSEVETFDATTFDFKTRCNLIELVNPWDLTSCKLNKCLYVMDRSSTTTNHVIRVDTYASPRVLGKWSTDTEYGNLSVTSDGNVIVTFCDSRRLVKIYGPNRTMTKIPPLSVDFINPTHALKLRNGQFLICHGINNDNSHRVCILNENFNIVNSFDQLKAPSYLAEDESGFICVADQGNNRVCVLNSDLTLKKEVVSKINGLRGPQRICFSVKAGKLLVVDNEILESKRQNGKLLILPYDLQSQ